MSVQDNPAPAGVDALLLRVGNKVRAARRDLSLSRRALSDRSGVSVRYLAQMESGVGNVSLSLLYRVASALDKPVAWFVADADMAGRANRICLIGLRGAGKSTLGRAAAAALDLPFVELNAEIEQQGGMPVAEIMALYGQEGYRALEAQALARVTESHDRLILAVAGGIVGDTQTYDALLSRFHTVWLQARPDEHMERVRAQGDERPMAGNPQAMAQLKAILDARSPLYARAEAALDTSERAEARSVNELMMLIEERGFLSD